MSGKFTKEYGILRGERRGFQLLEGYRYLRSSNQFPMKRFVSIMLGITLMAACKTQEPREVTQQ